MEIINIYGSSWDREYLIVIKDEYSPTNEDCEKNAESIAEALLNGLPARTWDCLLAKMNKFQQEHDDI